MPTMDLIRVIYTGGSGKYNRMETTEETKFFFECLGEIWRDITAIEFLMRCAIAKTNGDIDKFPLPPYTKGRVYNHYPNSFSHYSFEIVVAKFNKRFPNLAIPPELIQLRDAMAHGITMEIENSGNIELVKFKESKDKSNLRVEFQLTLELIRITQIKQSLGELRRHIMKVAGD